MRKHKNSSPFTGMWVEEKNKIAVKWAREELTCKSPNFEKFATFCRGLIEDALAL